ncbi:hypothetical protein C1X62_13755 [Pseudomonas sp. FW215-R3]|nr:hypothetical protein C1X62_13755 [Pseudomonas sp. FW215-R3]
MGAGLLAMAAWQSTEMLDVMASSRASSLPQLFCMCRRISGGQPRRQSTPAPPTTPAPGCSC